MGDSREELAEVARDLARHARWAQRLGETQAPVAGEAATGSGLQATAISTRSSPAPGAPQPFLEPEARSLKPASPTPTGRPTLDSVRAELGDCTRCKLCKGRKNLVFGVGNPAAQLVFVGEGPGADEDLQGIPFVGKAGQLLTKMIEAMGFRRDDVYICNVVKCRPPNNRNPEPDEIRACEPFLKGQLSAIGPKVIVTLGKFAAQTLLQDPTPITRLRGRWRTYQLIALMPTFHPAYLLRSPDEKAKAWEDLKLVLQSFGREPPPRRR